MTSNVSIGGQGLLSGREHGTIALGIVVELDDGRPENETRVKVRIPTLHGPMKRTDLPPEWSNAVWTDDDHLPWVPICYNLGTRIPRKGPMIQLNEILYIAYTGANASGPVIIGTTTKIYKE